MLFSSKFAGFSIADNRSPIISSNGGTFIQVPKRYNIRFKNVETNEFVWISDYGCKKKRRNDRLQDFLEHYKPLYDKKHISVICLVVYADEIKNVNDFIQYFKYKKLKNLGIKATSHIRINDIGNKSKRPHCHVFIIINRIESSLYDKIFIKSKERKYKGIPMNRTFGLIQYCQKKELYVKGKGKSWSASPFFKQPRLLRKI